MLQCLSGPLARHLVVYRQRVATAPVLLECEPLSHATVRQDTPVRWRWKGRTVTLSDGATVSRPDTPANQQESPQPTPPQQGLGCPSARLLGVCSLASGGLVMLAAGRYQGQETGELAWLRQVEDSLAPGKVVLGDRCDRSYVRVASLQAHGVDDVGRQPQWRHADCRRGQQLGSEDHLSSWATSARPAWREEAPSQQVPDYLQGRELRVRAPRKGLCTGVLLVVTTLLTLTAAPRRTSQSGIVADGLSHWSCGRSKRHSG